MLSAYDIGGLKKGLGDPGAGEGSFVKYDIHLIRFIYITFNFFFNQSGIICMNGGKRLTNFLAKSYCAKIFISIYLPFS